MPTNESPVPLVDLSIAHRRVAATVQAGFDQVLARTAFILGPQVTQFESEFASYSEAGHCVGVANGTDAIEMALRACDVGPGDEVVIPANTFVATAEAVVRAGATIVLADCADDYLIDPDSVRERLTPRTRAVIGVHLYGQMAPMARLREVVGPDVLLIEDAAQSQGARQDGRRSCSVGVAAATSFYPGKNLGAYGDAGATLTSSPVVAERLMAMRNHGGIKKYEHSSFGFNSRIDTLQAVVLSAKLAVLDDWNDERRAAADRYASLLADVDGVTRPVVAPGNEHVWHLYVVAVEDRDRVLAQLNGVGIGAGIHYPAPVHELGAFAHLGYAAGDLPVSERASRRIISLPIYPGITVEQQERVARELVAAVRQPTSVGS